MNSDKDADYGDQCQDLSMHSNNQHLQPPPNPVFAANASQQQQVANILALSKLIQTYRQRLQGDEQPPADVIAPAAVPTNPQLISNLILNAYNQQRLANPSNVTVDTQQILARFQQQLQSGSNGFQPQLHQQILMQLAARNLNAANNNNPRPPFPIGNPVAMMASPPPPTSPSYHSGARGGHYRGRGGRRYQPTTPQTHLQHQLDDDSKSHTIIDVGNGGDDVVEQESALDLQLMDSSDSPKADNRKRKHSKMSQLHDSNKLPAVNGASNNGNRAMFTLLDLDLVLYGIVKTHDGSSGNGHAISCLSLSHLGYNLEKILSSNCDLTQSNNNGRNHHRANCPSTPDVMLLDLPEGFTIDQSTFGGCIHYGVFAQREVMCGTRFGPFQGRQVNPSEIKTNDDNTFMWEIFKDNKLSHFIDGRGSNGNWLAYVNCARFEAEQNLVAMQENGQIYYEACRDITPGTELLVWYGDEYAHSMGIPVGLKDEAAAMEVSGENEEDGSDNPEGFACERCGKVFAYKYYRDKHLKYTRCVDMGDRKFPCHLCNRSFEKRDRLRIHVLHVHEKHRPHKCTVCGKSFSQSSSLNKHMRVHSGERPYKCVYCSKAFTASSILRTHIRQHSGEKPFKCRHCGKSFASHAAHDSHVRRTHLRPANDNGMMMGTETPTSVLSQSPPPSPQPSASLVIFPG